MNNRSKKYEFTGETCIVYNGVELHRIRALKDISGVVSAGELGGWLEKENNLSQRGGCWVSGEAKVFDRAVVGGDAKVYGSAEVSGNAKVYGVAEVYGGAKVYERAAVYGRAKVYGGAEVYGQADVFDRAEVYGFAVVTECACVCGCAKAYEEACVREDAQIYGHAEVCGNTVVYGGANVTDGVLKSSRDYIMVGPIGSRNAYTSFNLTTGTVQTGCFKGTLDEFEKAIEETHKGNEHAVAYNTVAEFFRKLSSVKGLASGELSS